MLSPAAGKRSLRQLGPATAAPPSTAVSTQSPRDSLPRHSKIPRISSPARTPYRAPSDDALDEQPRLSSPVPHRLASGVTDEDAHDDDTRDSHEEEVDPRAADIGSAFEQVEKGVSNLFGPPAPGAYHSELQVLQLARL